MNSIFQHFHKNLFPAYRILSHSQSPALSNVISSIDIYKIVSPSSSKFHSYARINFVSDAIRIEESKQCHQIRTLSTANCNLQQKALSKHVRKDSFGEKAKEATKNTYYGAVLLTGLGIMGLMGYTLFKELLAPFSTQSVYSDAVERCTNHQAVMDRLGGDSIKCYGEEGRRGRRNHVSHLNYELEGQKGMRLKFHLKGTRRTATCHLDARDAVGGWKYRYLYVQMDDYPNDVIVLEDNRAGENSSPAPSVGELKPIFSPTK